MPPRLPGHTSWTSRTSCTRVTPGRHDPMSTTVAAEPNARARWIGDLDTPVALVDVNRLERNLAGMAAVAAGSATATLRPHTKTHKTREIARRQLEHGAAGLTVAKVGEAEAMVAAGFDDLYIAYPLVGEAKYERLLPLLDRARIRFDVESAAAAEAASA